MMPPTPALASPPRIEPSPNLLFPSLYGQRKAVYSSLVRSSVGSVDSLPIMKSP
jgi:hypothetical protein